MHILMHILLILLLLLLLLGPILGFRVLPLFFIDQIVHSHNRLFSVTMIRRVLLLILAFVLLRSHGLIDVARRGIVIPCWSIFLLMHILGLFGWLRFVLIVALIILNWLLVFLISLFVCEFDIFLNVKLWTTFLCLLIFHALWVITMGTFV